MFNLKSLSQSPNPHIKEYATLKYNELKARREVDIEAATMNAYCNMEDNNKKINKNKIQCLAALDAKDIYNISELEVAKKFFTKGKNAIKTETAESDFLKEFKNALSEIQLDLLKRAKVFKVNQEDTSQSQLIRNSRAKKTIEHLKSLEGKEKDLFDFKVNIWVPYKNDIINKILTAFGDELHTKYGSPILNTAEKLENAIKKK